ncbi:MAG: NADH-quinone oxidoreductase subunit J [Candidatus Latescibacteria bacterium]|jgi:NADH-quinone oxidoreductase subunit J|nr:NADH-quinone oxidoreductase subunit J [Candidatus Latescibacterota bacterium]
METTDFAFYVFSILAVVGAAVVALAPRIVYAAFSLLATFGGVAGLFVLLGADFLAVSQIFVYVGGILVLLLFGIMLTQNVADVQLTTSRVQTVPGLAVASGVLFVMLTVIWTTDWSVTEPTSQPMPTTAAIGEALASNYLFPFELAALILLMALVGAASIARSRKSDEPQTDDQEA